MLVAARFLFSSSPPYSSYSSRGLDYVKIKEIRRFSKVSPSRRGVLHFHEMASMPRGDLTDFCVFLLSFNYDSTVRCPGFFFALLRWPCGLSSCLGRTRKTRDFNTLLSAAAWREKRNLSPASLFFVFFCLVFNDAVGPFKKKV